MSSCRCRANRRWLAAKRENRSDRLTEEQDAEFRSLSSDLELIETRIEELEESDRRTSTASAVSVRYGLGGAGHRSQVYGPENRASYFGDLVASARQTADVRARDRLASYDQEQRDLNRADGSGGVFVPPQYLLQDVVGAPRPGRVTADLMTRRPLPAGTDVINVPKILTGTSTAIQPADNDPVQEVDLTDSVIAAPVRTIAGQQDIALQLLDQSPVNFDEVIIRDLLADYARRVGLQVLTGTGATGQLLGVQNVTGVEQVAWTSTTPTAVDFQKRVADAVSRIAGAIYAPPNAIVMHPRRWAWLLIQNDTSNRPLIVPEAQGPSNAQGILAGGAEGRVGTFAGLPVYVDSNIATNTGVGLNQDVVLVLNSAETILYESQIRTRVLPEVLSGTLTVRVQIYGYAAMATRQAKSIAVISGTGLTPPVFT
jgi:HK97 family phage major capsid protein